MSSWSKLINEKLSEAIDTGELEMPEALAGKPLDLDAYFSTPPELRMGYSILASSGHTPMVVDLLKEINRLKDLREHQTDADERTKIEREINRLEVEINVTR